MKLGKLLVAGAMVVIGGVGIALGTLGVIETRSMAGRLARDIPWAVGRVETVVITSIERAEWAADFVQTTRDRLAEIQEMVDRFSQEDKGRLTTLLNRLDVDVVERLERAEEFVRSLQAGLQSANSMMVLLESLPFLTPRAASPARPDHPPTESLSADVAAINETLELIARALSNIRTKGTADPEQVALLRNALRRVDEEIRDVQAALEDVTSEFVSLGQTLATTRRTSVERIRRVALFGQAFFVCFAAAQLSLAWGGIRSAGASFGFGRSTIAE